MRCPVCGGSGTSSAFTADGVAYRACPACGVRYAVGDANADFGIGLDEYPSAYLQYLAPDAADERNHAAVVQQLRGFGVAIGAAPLLDVGCGGGKLVRHLRARGVEAYGVEPAEPLFDRFLAGEPWFFRDLGDAAAAAGRPFAVVLALDVVEHVADPVGFLTGLRKLAAPDGRVVISTPDGASLAARVLGRHWHHFNRFHLSLLGEDTMHIAASRAGLRVDAIRHPGRYRSVGYVVRYFFEFLLRRTAPRWIESLDHRFVAINVWDTMLVSLRPSASQA
jgi:SAM-dependent methyltransferase